jgi:hypothetical protein
MGCYLSRDQSLSARVFVVFSGEEFPPRLKLGTKSEPVVVFTHLSFSSILTKGPYRV